MSEISDLPAERRVAEPGLELLLDPICIAETIETLAIRIEERFPGSGLARVCRALLAIARSTAERIEVVGRPNVPLRVSIGLLLVIVAALVGKVAWSAVLGLPRGVEDLATFLAILESGLNDVVFLGVALVFLLTVESRLKRRRTLRHVRELRALAHIVDMHQLSKDPDRLIQRGADTPHSPERGLTRFETGRYLDYCTEILSLTSKVAALYAERFDDAVVLQAVDEIETLTTGQSRKIWQKIMILDSIDPVLE